MRACQTRREAYALPDTPSVASRFQPRMVPDLALLATLGHVEKGVPFWHWAVFVRDPDEITHVLDSKPSLRSHARTDFERITPKWFISVRR